MKLLLTGTPGSGKTTLVQYAHKLGDKKFFDADEVTDLCEWQEFATGQAMGSVKEFVEDGTDTWYKKYGWYWRADALTDFLLDFSDVVLCGSSENVTNFYDAFDCVILLIDTPG